MGEVEGDLLGRDREGREVGVERGEEVRVQRKVLPEGLSVPMLPGSRIVDQTSLNLVRAGKLVFV